MLSVSRSFQNMAFPLPANQAFMKKKKEKEKAFQNLRLITV